MKQILIISLFLSPIGLFAQQTGDQHNANPGVVKTGNTEKKQVGQNKKKAVVFTEKPERVIIDTLTGKEIRISLEQPSVTPPKQ